jgi:hypothetical protein
MIVTFFAFDEEGAGVVSRVLLLSLGASLYGASVQAQRPAVPTAAFPNLRAVIAGSPNTTPSRHVDPAMPNAAFPNLRALFAGPTTTVGRLADAAVSTLSAVVTKQSHPDALRLAVQAYYNFRNAHPEQVRKPYLYFVDYGLDNRTPRGYVFDMAQMKLVDGPFIVAHGRGSLNTKNGVPMRFSNRPGSATTSLGLYVAQETYAFSGKSGGRRYRSIGLRLSGVSDRFNSTARERGIVVHGAPYVTPSGAGRSEGCPAMDQSRAQRLIPKIANGGLVFLFSPQDSRWLSEDPWLRADTN